MPPDALREFNPAQHDLKTPERQPPRPRPIKYGHGDFLALRIPPRESVLAPIIPEKGLAMVYAPRGLGKTHVALGIAYAVAAGTSF